MRVAQPVLYMIPSFDAALGANINFAYEGEQVFANELAIYDNETGAQVYDQKISWMRTYHTIDAGKLSNGKYYYCKIRVFNKTGNASDWSAQRSFRCFTTPVFGISNLTADQIVQDSEIRLIFTYTQKEDEPLNTYAVTLYNANHVQISKSETLYGVDALEYTLKNLEDGTKYYVRVTGETLNGMAIDSGYVPFSVKYITPSYWTFVDLSDNNDGTVRISCNIRILSGRFEGDGNQTYINDNNMIDLRDGSRVIFDDGFTIQGDFTLKLLGYDFTVDTPILELIDVGDNRLTIVPREGWFEKGSWMAGDSAAEDESLGVHVKYFELRCVNMTSGMVYTIHTTAVPELTDGEEYLIEAKRIGTECELTVSIRNATEMISVTNL